MRIASAVNRSRQLLGYPDLSGQFLYRASGVARTFLGEASPFRASAQMELQAKYRSHGSRMTLSALLLQEADNGSLRFIMLMKRNSVRARRTKIENGLEKVRAFCQGSCE